MTYPLGFERSARVLEQIRDEDIAPLIHIADTDPDVEKRRRALVTLGNAGILPPLHWVPLARTPLLAAPRKAAHFDPAFEADVEREARAAAAVLDASAPPRSEDVDLSGCGAPGKRHRYKGSPICLRCKRPDPRASSRKVTITSPEQPANRKPDGCLEVGVGPVCEGPGAASFDAAAGSALGEPTGDTSTVLPSEPPPCTPAPISPASQGGSQTVGTVEDPLPATVPAALPHSNLNETEQNDAGLPEDVRQAVPGRLGSLRRPRAADQADADDRAGGAGRVALGAGLEGGPLPGDHVQGREEEVRGEQGERRDHLGDRRVEVERELGRASDHALRGADDGREAEDRGNPGRAGRSEPERAGGLDSAARGDGDRDADPADAGGDRGDQGAGAVRGGTGSAYPGKLIEPVRFSHLKTLGTLSPAHLAARVEFKPTASMERGTAVHALLFGTREVVAYHGRRAGKAWDEFKAAYGDEAHILTAGEYAKAQDMAAAVRAHPWASKLLGPGAVYERTILWKHCGIECRSTPDIAHADWIVDLKTSRTSKPDWFGSLAVKSFYHAQMAFYGEARRASGRPAPKFYYVICVESFAPYVVTCFKFTERAIDAGNKLWRAWFEKLVVAHTSGEWTPYTQAIEEIDVMDEFEAEFGSPQIVTFGDEEEQADAVAA